MGYFKSELEDNFVSSICINIIFIRINVGEMGHILKKAH
jgi:hypothetical protein